MKSHRLKTDRLKSESRLAMPLCRKWEELALRSQPYDSVDFDFVGANFMETNRVEINGNQATALWKITARSSPDSECSIPLY